jgi:hypothetical protein
MVTGLVWTLQLDFTIHKYFGFLNVQVRRTDAVNVKAPIRWVFHKFVNLQHLVIRLHRPLPREPTCDEQEGCQSEIQRWIAVYFASSSRLADIHITFTGEQRRLLLVQVVKDTNEAAKANPRPTLWYHTPTLRPYHRPELDWDNLTL